MNIKNIALIAVGIIGIGIKFGVLDQITWGKTDHSGQALTVLSSEDQAALDKLQPFIECLNLTDKSLRQHAAKYRQHFLGVSADPTKDYYGFSSFKITVYETNNEFSKACATGLRTAIAQSPADTVLDNAGRDYAKTLETVIPLLNETDDYYKQKNYYDDKMAKGRELDAKIWPLLTYLGELSNIIHAAVDQWQDHLADARLTGLEKTVGKDFHWQSKNVLLQASRSLKKIEHVMENNQFQIQPLIEAEAQIQQAYDAGVAYTTAHPDVKTYLGNKPLWFSLQDYAQNYLTAVKNFRRNVSEGKRDKVSSDYDQVVKEYNSLIKDYNLSVNNGGE